MVKQGIESIGDNMRKGIIKESVVVGLTTLGIGSAMMVLPIRQNGGRLREHFWLDFWHIWALNMRE